MKNAFKFSLLALVLVPAVSLAMSDNGSAASAVPAEVTAVPAEATVVPAEATVAQAAAKEAAEAKAKNTSYFANFVDTTKLAWANHPYKISAGLVVAVAAISGIAYYVYNKYSKSKKVTPKLVR